MAASPHLSRKLQAALGDDAGTELIAIVDRAANDISELRGDVAELRHQMEVGFTRINARFDQESKRVDARFEQQNAMFERGMREQTRFFFVAWGVILAAIIGLYAR
jgi:hypothetical protein